MNERKENKTIELWEIDGLIERYRGKEGVLIPLLQDVQDMYGYVPEEAVKKISKELSIYPVKAYEVLTFYSQFHLRPRGRHTIKVCQGTACHVMGGREILNYFSEKLGVNTGGTTSDGMFSLERVACLGCCGIAPVVVIDDKFYGRVTVKKIDKILHKYREEADR